MSGPLVSVVVPARNAERTIRETLASVGAQDLEDHEVVVVDDASHDATAELVAAVAERDPRVRLVAAAAGSVGGARNAGAAASRGRLLTFLDADDLLPSDSLRRRVDVLAHGADHDVAAVAGGLVAFGRQRSLRVPALPLDEEVELRCRRADVLPCHVGTILLSRTAFDRVGGFSEDIGAITPAGGEDLLFVSDLVRSGADFQTLDHVVLRYRIHADSASAALRPDLSVAAAFARAVALARTAGGRAPEAGEFLQQYGDQVRRRSCTDVDAHLRRALWEYCSGSIRRSAAAAVRAFIRDPRYCTWRLRQRGLAPHDPQWGSP